MAFVPFLVVSLATAVLVKCQEIEMPRPPFFRPPDIVEVISLMRKSAEEMMRALPDEVERVFQEDPGKQNGSAVEVQSVVDGNLPPNNVPDARLSLAIGFIPIPKGNGSKARPNATTIGRALSEGRKKIVQFVEAHRRPGRVEVHVESKEILPESAAKDKSREQSEAAPSSPQATVVSAGEERSSAKGSVHPKESEVDEVRIVPIGRGPRNVSQVLEEREKQRRASDDIVTKCYNLVLRHGLLALIVVILCAFSCFLGSILPTLWERHGSRSQFPKDRWLSAKILADPRFYGIFRNKHVVPPTRAAAGDSF